VEYSSDCRVDRGGRLADEVSQGESLLPPENIGC
jgi:hypothetical protein